MNQAPRPKPEGLGQRIKRLVFEGAKFGTVGAIAFLVDNGTYFLLVSGPGHLLAPWPVRASILASVIATAVSYGGNRYWTFSEQRHRGTPGKPGRVPVKEAVMYAAANLAGVLITGACLYFSRWILDFHSPSADAIARNTGIVLGTIFRYLAYKFWIFSAKPKETP